MYSGEALKRNRVDATEAFDSADAVGQNKL